MDLGLKDKVVVITGGTAGLGKGLIPAFLAEGCKVAACGRTEATNAAVQREFPAALIIRADAASRQDVEALAAAAARAYGGIDIWINNAGILVNGLLTEMTEEQWDTLMRVNLTGVFTGTRTAAPYLTQRGGGVIINASSFASVIPSVASGAYAASKAGVSSLTRTFAAELAPRNIRVVEYIPGVFDTPMNERAIETSRENLLRPIPLRRFGEARDLAPAVVFLASDKAAYITGTSMVVSGGKFCVQNPQQAW
jgi:NAD(P)-dependent dehydrogenase (short-subunit alcohol dehydrogenase family)